MSLILQALCTRAGKEVIDGRFCMSARKVLAGATLSVVL